MKKSCMKILSVSLISILLAPYFSELSCQATFTETEVEFKADTVLAEAEFMYCKHLDPSVASTNVCLGKYIEEWENILNKYYQKLLPYTGGDMRVALVGSHYNWRSFMEKEVDLYYSIISEQLNGGTIGNVGGAYRAELIKERAIRTFHYYLFILDD